MLKNYTTVALRTLRKQALYSGINFVGLALGLACALVVYALVSHELRFDAHHESAEETYRVGALWPEWSDDGPSYQPQTPTALVPHLRAGVPGVERVAEVVVSYGDRSIYAEGRFLTQDGIAFVGPEFFDVFDYDLREGRTERLSDPNTVVLTETTARRYFGNRSAVGETVRYSETRILEVVAVVADPRATTHLPFVFFASIASTEPTYDEWGFSDGHSAYVVLQSGASASAVEDRLNAIRRAHQTEEEQAEQAFLLQPLTEIHTEPRYGAYPGATVVAPMALWGLGVVGLLILLSAVVNYVNLATAQGVARAREIGIRKAIGGTRGQIGGQLLGETALLTAAAVAVGWVAAVGLLAPVGDVLGTDIGREALLRPEAVGATVALAALVSLLAGSYPAATLSRVQPAATLRGLVGTGSGARGFRKGLIAFQFVATLSLTLGAIVVFQQTRYIQDKDLGFEPEGRVMVRVQDGEAGRVQFRDALRQMPAVRNVTYAMGGPTKDGRLSQRYTWNGIDRDDARSLRTIPIDAQYVDAFGLELIAGRDVQSGDESAPHSRVVLVNRSMTELLGFDDPAAAIGATIRGEGANEALGDLEVVGVVDDFHHGSLHTAIDPSVMLYWPRWTHWAGIAFAPDRTTEGLAAVEAAFDDAFPNAHFRYDFLDGYLSALYESEQQVAKAFRGLTVLSILIACLGLFGLAALATTQRRREVGIRKVLGASATSIVVLLSREVVQLVALAFAVAAPLTYVLIRRWLDGYAYRIDIGVGLFVVAGSSVLLVALLTVSSQAVRAATTDPIRALRSD